MRKRIRYFDMEKIERDNEPLTDVEREVKEKLSYDPRESLYARLEIENALGVLTDKQKNCLLLSIVDGFTDREIAERLSISHQAVNRLITKAKQKVRKFLEGVAKPPLKCPIPMEGGQYVENRQNPCK